MSEPVKPSQAKAALNAVHMSNAVATRRGAFTRTEAGVRAAGAGIATIMLIFGVAAPASSPLRMVLVLGLVLLAVGYTAYGLAAVKRRGAASFPDELSVLLAVLATGLPVAGYFALAQGWIWAPVVAGLAYGLCQFLANQYRLRQAGGAL